MPVRPVLLALLLLWAAAGRAQAEVNARVTTAGAEAGCPGRQEVEAALEARIPSITTAPAALVDKTLALELEPVDAGVDLALRDDRGEVVLRRHLVPEARSRARGRQRCWALAEAAAVVITRYLEQIGVRPRPEPPPAAPAADEPRVDPDARAVVPRPAPAPAFSTPGRAASPAESADRDAAGSPAGQTGPPAASPGPGAVGSNADPADAIDAGGSPAGDLSSSPGPRASAADMPVQGFLGAGVGGRIGVGEGDRYPRAELLIGLALHVGAVALAFDAGASAETRIDVPGPSPQGRLALRAYPLRAGLGLPVPFGAGGWLVPAVAAGVDLLGFSASDLADARSGLRTEPVVEAGLSYLATGGPLYGRIRVMGGLTLRSHSFDALRSEPVFRTPDAYLRAQLEIGTRLGKL